jgi:hypothetical protein
VALKQFVLARLRDGGERDLMPMHPMAQGHNDWLILEIVVIQTINEERQGDLPPTRRKLWKCQDFFLIQITQGCCTGK